MSVRRMFAHRRGGLLPDRTVSARLTATALADAWPAARISWLTGLPVGDDQGAEGACAIFACLSWWEAMSECGHIDDDRKVRIYRDAIRYHGRESGDGLTFREAFAACQRAGYMEDCPGIVAGTMRDMLEQPLLVAVRVNEALDNPDRRGVLDHSRRARDSRVRGYHAMLAPAVGPRDATGVPWLTFEQSWGEDCGDRGIVHARQDVAQEIVTELHAVVLRPGHGLPGRAQISD